MRSSLLLTTLITSLWTAPLTINGAAGADREDILVADFEGDDYGAWTVEGEAFGPGPAKGTLPGQMGVSGYRGEGLVNSFYEGDGTIGTLTSPPLKVDRRYLIFLIGGGGYAGTTCMNLLHGGEVVRTATGNNDEPGGTEALAPYAWDLTDLLGKTVRIQIVDRRTGGWGHVNVDHIVQTDRKPAIPKRPGAQTRELNLAKKYLLFPIQNGVKTTRIDLRVGGQNVREFAAELARTKEEISFWSFLDISAFKGELATLHLSAATEDGAALIAQSNDLPVVDDLYAESLRPQFHFSQMLGWNNDPNGMVYYDGEWHLYFQHNPYGWKWGNMHWGHAISKDLVHWEQLPIAIYNKRRGDWAFSGGAVVDENNTAGWQTGREKVIVASWTSTGRGECVAYSNDRGRTFTEYEGNPVIKHGGRDPKIIWYEPGKHWVLAVYDESEEDGRSIAFYSSRNMKEWKLESKLRGYYECAELFELPIDGDKKNTRWVVFAADARYAIGKFDGKVFTPEHDGKHRVHHGAYYASQLFSNTPDGRRIQIGWAKINMPGMPFNQTFSFPHRLTLRTTSDGVRMFAEPVKEIEKLYGNKYSVTGGPSGFPLRQFNVSGELLDIRATFQVGGATSVGLDIGGNRIIYDAKQGKLNGADLKPVDGKVSIRVLVDRPMLEIIGNHGRVYITSNRDKRGEVSRVTAFADGGSPRLLRFEVHESRIDLEEGVITMRLSSSVAAAVWLVLSMGFAPGVHSAEGKVKVFILAGQSNMEGHGQLRSLDHLGQHPKYGHLLKKLKNGDGSWASRNDVTIAWTHKNAKHGPLTVGWGAEEHEIGPELMFGTVMGDQYEVPVLLIKTAWGGKDVFCDFRSPGAGKPTGDEEAVLKKERSDNSNREIGHYYREMVAEIKACLANIQRVVPGYQGQGYEIAGMAWFQGWNDFCQWHVHLDEKHVGPAVIKNYPRNLAAMFRDLRKDLGAPNLPIVIGELGVGGHEIEQRAKDDDHEARALVDFRKAQKTVGDDESLENVTFVPTADYWDTRLQELRRVSDAYWEEKQKKGIKDTEENHLPTRELNDEYLNRGGHWYAHYNGSAANYSLIGYALATALVEAEK